MKKLTINLLLGVGLCVLLAGCGNPSVSQNTATNDGSETTWLTAIVKLMQATDAMAPSSPPVAPPPELPPLPDEKTPLLVEVVPEFHQPEGDLVALAFQQAVGLGLATDDELKNQDWQTAKLTRGELATWLARWVEGYTDIPAVNDDGGLSPYVDMDATDEGLAAMRLAQTYHWLPFTGENHRETETNVVYAHPTKVLTYHEMLQAIDATQAWLARQDDSEKLSAPLVVNELDDNSPDLLTRMEGDGLFPAVFGIADWQERSPEAQQMWLAQSASRQVGLLAMAFWVAPPVLSSLPSPELFGNRDN